MKYVSISIILLFTLLHFGLIEKNISQTANTLDAKVKIDTDSTEIIQLLKNRDQQIKKLLGPEGTSYTEEQRQKIKDIINGIIDYRAMAEYALATTWDTLATAQKDDFVHVFSQVVRNQSMNKLDIYRADIRYKQVKMEGDTALVGTMAILDNVRTPVHYTLTRKNGEWVVIDFSIDGVSTAKSYRRSFQNIIRRKGYATLYNSLEKKSSS